MSTRLAIAAAASILGAAACIGLLNRPDRDLLWPADFVEYWAAATLTLHGKNPYDPEQLLPLERSAGRQTDRAVMMWNPPWALAIVLPLGLFPAREAQLLWMAVNVLALGFCADRLWLLLGGARPRRWVGWLIVFVALPSEFAVHWGQIGPLLLLGAVLFLECQTRGWQFAAGAAAVLLAIKPHLVYLVWAAIGIDALFYGRWRAIAGGIVAGLACVAVALAFSPHVLHDYVDAMRNHPPAHWATPTLGTVLRLIFGKQLFLLQFIPVAIGLTWFVYRQEHAATRCATGGDRDWREELPLLLLVSFLTSPYGWHFDMVLLFPATVWLVIRSERPVRGSIVAGLAAIDVGCIAVNHCTFDSFWFFWVPPALLILYAISRSRRSSRTVDVPSSSVSLAFSAPA